MSATRFARSAIRLPAAILAIWLCTPTLGHAQTISVGGTGGALAVLEQLGRAFALDHPGVRLDVLPSMGSSGGIRALSDGAIDIAVSGRSLRAEEQEGGALVEVPFARTAIAFLTSHRGEINLPVEMAVEMFGDAGATWSDGTDVRIVARPQSESDYQAITAVYPLMQDALARAGERPDVPVAVTDQENLELAAMMEGSLTVGTVLQVWSEDVPLYLLALDGTAPTLDNVASGRYPLVKEYCLVFRADADPIVQDFIGFIEAEEGAEILRRAGALPVE